MEDMTKIKGVLGYCLYQDDSPVAGAQAGKLGDSISEVEQFWSSAASVVANNLKLEQVKEVVLSGKDRQVMMILKGDSLLLCELDPRADWRAVASEARRKL
jgi:predicted regulator of Ras-like GTPase activity (Roadblock/LC7/MglB family)